MKIGYARVSTQDQKLELQIDALQQDGCKRIYQEKKSGKNKDRAELQQLFTDAHQRKFDLVLFWSLDRFSREGVRQTINYLAQLESYGVQFKSYTEPYLDSTGIFKEVIISLLATLAKQEKVRQSERVKAGLDRVKSKGVVLGRPTIAVNLGQQIKKLVAEGLADRAIGRKLNISHRSVAKYKN